MHRFALIVPVVLASVAQAGPGLWFVGYAPNCSEGWVYGLTQDGSLAVGVTGNASGSMAPGFTWTAGGGRDDFGLEQGMPAHTIAQGVSTDGGVLVGWKATASFQQVRAFRRVGSNPLEDLGLLPNEVRSYASGVSGDGQIVVGTCEHGPSNSGGQAFRWTPQGGMTGLGFLKPQSDFSKAYGISRDGSTIVGMSQTVNFDTDAFRWTEGEGMVELPGFDGAKGSVTAFATNADGSVAVGASSTSDDSIRPARWVGTTLQDLGVLPGFTRGIAYAVDDSGGVVGGTLDTPADKQAFVWTQDAGMTLLKDLLADHGIDVPADYRLTYVYAISGDGLTFGGLSFNLVTNQQEGFVATIPSPPALLLFIAPCFSFRRRRG